MKILRLSRFRAILYMNHGRQIELSCSKGEVGKLIDYLLLPTSTEFRCLRSYNRALAASMEDTSEMDIHVLDDVS